MANLEVIALDTATPQLKAPQAGDGYAMPRPVTVTEVVGSTALTLTGATQTTAVPVLNATQTWNNVATTFTGIKLNVTDTTSAAASLLLDLQTGGGSPVSKFNISKTGNATFGTQGSSLINNITGTNAFSIYAANTILFNRASGTFGVNVDHAASRLALYQDYYLGFATGNNGPDAYISRKAAASLQLGNADAAAPVAQTIGPQSVVAGTSNTAGQNFTVRGSQGTGTGAGGSILFQTAPAGSAGTAQNALVTQMTIGTDGSLTLVDTPIVREAADTLAQRRTTNAQAFRVYNTYTDASNYERLAIKWASNIATLAIENAGTGANRGITLQGKGEAIVESVLSGITFRTSSTNRWYVTVSGPFIAAVDNTHDIGASGASRPRIGYFGTRVDAPTLRTDTAYTVATLPAAGVAGRRAYVTDALAPTYLGAMTGGGAVVTPVFDNGTAWVAG